MVVQLDNTVRNIVILKVNYNRIALLFQLRPLPTSKTNSTTSQMTRTFLSLISTKWKNSLSNKNLWTCHENFSLWVKDRIHLQLSPIPLRSFFANSLSALFIFLSSIFLSSHIFFFLSTSFYSF
jgi:hypothetical protein